MPHDPRQSGHTRYTLWECRHYPHCPQCGVVRQEVLQYSCGDRQRYKLLHIRIPTAKPTVTVTAAAAAVTVTDPAPCAAPNTLAVSTVGWIEAVHHTTEKGRSPCLCSHTSSPVVELAHFFPLTLAFPSTDPIASWVWLRLDRMVQTVCKLVLGSARNRRQSKLCIKPRPTPDAPTTTEVASEHLIHVVC
jgi:hypothetical protein